MESVEESKHPNHPIVTSRGRISPNKQLGKQVMVSTVDGRRFFGKLESVDCKRNIVLKKCLEEVPIERCSVMNENIDMYIRK